uniref:Solute carrier family 35 member F6 n=1 Tax=Cacopsylla melanoneura TaxID=428564 RepID=A0A8D9BRV3_9HEMI
MAWTVYHYGLAFVMVVTGSINTLSTKWADHLKSVGSDGVLRGFDHPFFQSCSMFLGELLCLLAFKAILSYYLYKQDTLADVRELVRGNRNFNPLVFVPPAMCDMIATSLMYIGLNLTYASSFQMLRGSVIIFVALLSVAFLNRNILPREWFGIVLIIMGLTVVGVSDFVSPSKEGPKDTNSVLTGDMLIVMAQIITAVQMIYEEKYVTKLDIPALQAVGWEGVFGFITTAVLLVPFYFIKVGKPFTDNSRGSLEDVPDAFVQLSNNPLLIIAILGTILSIAFFNFAGISVTKEMSATTRMVLDTVRTLFIWLISLWLGWQDFHPLQIVGFGLLIFGLCVYNNLMPSPHSMLTTAWVARSNRHNPLDEDDFINQPADCRPVLFGSPVSKPVSLIILYVERSSHVDELRINSAAVLRPAKLERAT